MTRHSQTVSDFYDFFWSNSKFLINENNFNDSNNTTDYSKMRLLNKNFDKVRNLPRIILAYKTKVGQDV